MKPKLTKGKLKKEAKSFAKRESLHNEPSLYGVTDGKAVGTYLEHKFQLHLSSKYEYEKGSSAKGIDFPELKVDIKVTSIRQPQSSCPYKSARQKIYGLGYSILLFVYEKSDDPETRTGKLKLIHTIFINSDKTADYQTTRGLIELLERDANSDDIMAFLFDRNLPIDDIQAEKLAHEIIAKTPQQGYLTISNALQWRLQYSRVVENAGKVNGVQRL